MRFILVHKCFRKSIPCSILILFYPIFINTTNWRLPFDWRNPIGYLVVITLQYTANVYFFPFAACLVAYALGILLHVLSVATDIKTDLKMINENAKIKQNRLMTLERLFEFIEFHSKLKELSIRASYISWFPENGST